MSRATLAAQDPSGPCRRLKADVDLVLGGLRAAPGPGGAGETGNMVWGFCGCESTAGTGLKVRSPNCWETVKGEEEKRGDSLVTPEALD